MSRLHHKSTTLALCGVLVACGSSADHSESLAELEGSSFASLDTDVLDAPESLALRHFEDWVAPPLDARTRVWVRRTSVDPRGHAHVRLAQQHRGLPVFGAEAIVHLREDGTLERITDDLVRGLDVETEPTLFAPDAVERALLAVGLGRGVSEAPDLRLMVLRHEGVDHLVYRVRLRYVEPDEEPAIPVVFVDAHTGAPIFSYDDLQHVALIDEDAATFDMLSGINYAAAVQADSADPVADQAQTHAKQSLQFFDTLGRDSFDDAGARVDSYVHFANQYVNAFWDGQRLTFGDGDGVLAGPLTSLDIVAHELAHGVTSETAALIYAGESGALNEATSDIFAAATEHFVDEEVGADTWMIGEEVWTPAIPGDALRYMSDPTQDGASRDHYSTRYLGPADNGGVHWNSGIANLFFYLLAQGGEHPDPAHRLGSITGIGIEAATEIWYAALVHQMTPDTDFAEARAATLAACAAQFGEEATQCSAVASAWCEVGVGGDACSAGNSCAEHCDGQAPGGCFCDPLCIQYADCCDDYVAQCLPGAPSCVGHCGGQSPGECWCEAGCQEYSDCCPDYEDACL